jgi:2-polyprenyl-3-methyl-5-hydroxy-6-metoxy-1,4-benzoquinol methylase
MKCEICSGNLTLKFEAEVLFKHQVKYYQCDNCGLMQTEKPYWLAEAYKKAITATDIGLISRNISTADTVFNLIAGHFDTGKKFLDFGGGYGILVRLLRDRGLDFYRQDIYCENIFALNHDITDLGDKSLKFEMVTCFEVFEHTYEPVKLMEELIGYADSILLSTLLVPDRPITSPDDWWYISPHTGQHVLFYTEKALKILGDKFNLYLYSNGTNMHLFTRKKFAANPLVYKNGLADKLKYRIIKFLAPEKKLKTSLIENDLNIAKLKAYDGDK